MISLFLYLLKSTVSLGIFYLLFRLLMRRETNFALSRILLLTLVVASVIVPLVQLPRVLQPTVKVEMIPDFSENRIQLQNSSEAGPLIQPEENLPAEEFTPESNLLDFSLPDFLMVIYCAGVLLSLLMLAKSIASVLLIFRSAGFRQMPGYRLYITENQMPSFAFGRSVVISCADYEQHGEAILAHEQSHIRQNHFYDLVLLELVRVFHWFNPAAHLLIGDMKELHEFQADSETLKSGINVTHYQLLIIQRGVGPRRFALATSFNHCQIKKRITMMNKLKTTKAKWWKAAAFLPLLAFLLMAFGRTGENALMKENLQASSNVQNDFKQLNKNQQSRMIIEIRNDGNYIDNKLCSLEEIKQRAVLWQKKNEEGIIYINSEKDVSISQAVEINDLLRKNNIKPVHLSNPAKNNDGENISHNDGNESQIVSSLSNESSQKLRPRADIFDSLLYVVDGMVYDKKSTKEIPPGDVQSISIINGKSAIEKFGEKGKNGAIIITTKIIGAEARNSRYLNNHPIDNKTNNNEIFFIVEDMPQFPGGDFALRKFIAENVKYPIEAQKEKIQGKVFVTFVINSKGKVEQVKIAKSVRDDLDAEAIRVVSLMPDWVPGKQKGKAVDVAYTIPIQFGLQSEESAQEKTNTVFSVVEEMPQFPGGDFALRKFIAENVKYPIEAQKGKIQGKVYVSFVVNSKGKVEKTKIVRGIRNDLDAEAIRVVSSLPDWIPGKNKGEAVDVAYAIPVQFALQSDKSTPEESNTVFLVADEMPQFPGGVTELNKFISSNIKYPELAKTDRAQGEVIVTFVVRSNGKIENPRIIKGIHPALDSEAIRIVNIFPSWRPGKQDGKTVDVSCTVPVKFNL